MCVMFYIKLLYYPDMVGDFVDDYSLSHQMLS